VICPGGIDAGHFQRTPATAAFRRSRAPRSKNCCATRRSRNWLASTTFIGALAEQERHHPDLCLSSSQVDVKNFHPKNCGRSENNFILARQKSTASFFSINSAR
jgi:pterin-4a-carbinolamine dehydratase